MTQVDPPQPWEQVDLLSLVSAAAAAPPAQPDPEPEPERQREAEPQPEPRAEAASAPPLAPASAAVPQRLLIIDTETTGLDPQTDRCIEVGAVLFDVAHRSVLSQVSFLLPCELNPAQAVNGIAPALTQQPQPWQQGLACFINVQHVLYTNSPFHVIGNPIDSGEFRDDPLLKERWVQWQQSRQRN